MPQMNNQHLSLLPEERPGNTGGIGSLVLSLLILLSSKSIVVDEEKAKI